MLFTNSNFNFKDQPSVHKELSEHGIAILKRAPHKTNDQLLNWAQSFSHQQGALEDKILHWDFGPIMEMKFDPQASNYLFSKERVPLHWDGAFHKEPSYLLFYCDKSSGTGGETLFCDTHKIYHSLDSVEKKAAQNIQIAFQTEKKAHYGGEIKVSFLQEHPRTKQPILRFAEEVVTELNPVSRQISGDTLGVINKIERNLDSFSIEHSWEQGDLIIVDNFRFIHGRRSLQNNVARSFRRIQIM